MAIFPPAPIGLSQASLDTLAERDNILLATIANQPSWARPGDAPEIYGLGTTVQTSISGSWLFNDTFGRVVRLQGNNVSLAPRRLAPIESGRIYLARFVFQRRTNTTDPANDAVEIGIAYFDANKNFLSEDILETVSTLTVASGRQSRNFTYSTDTSARYARPFVRVFGSLPRTDVEVLGTVDITDSDAARISLADFEARFAAVETSAEGLVNSLSGPINPVGEWDASSGAFPTTRPDNSPIQSRDAWLVTTGGVVDGVTFANLDWLLSLGTGGLTFDGNWLRSKAPAIFPTATANYLIGWNAAGTDLENKPPIAIDPGSGAVDQSSGGTGATTLGDALVTPSGGVPGVLADWLGAIRTPAMHGGNLGEAMATGPVLVNENVAGGAQILTVSGAMAEWVSGKWTSQAAYSGADAFFTNSGPQSGITLKNPQIDGSLYPSPIKVTFDVGSTTTAVVFKSPASVVDNFYTGLFLQIVTGANIAVRLVTGYNGATRTATLSAGLSSAPLENDLAIIGRSDSAVSFSSGVENIRILGGVVKNYPMNKMVGPTIGGKGISFEQGCRDCEAVGVTVENCATAFFSSGQSGVGAEGVRFIGGYAEACGSLLTIANFDGAAGIPDAGDQVEVVASGLTYHNCGHAPYRITGTQQQKSGIINLMGCSGATISDIRGHNDPSFAVYPTDYPSRSGFGLSGDVGAFVWGHARNTTLRNLHHHGNLDSAVHVGRVFSLGDDAPPLGVVTQMRGWNIDGLTVTGTVGLIVSRDEFLGVNGAEITGYWRIAVGAATAFVPSGLSSATTLTLDITEIATGKRVIGTPAQLLTRGNTFADYPDGTTNLTESGAAQTVEIFTASGTWVKPVGAKVIRVELWGGGGGGGGSAGGGGGAGVVATYNASNLPDSVLVTIGAGGAASTGTGGTGGTSTFGALLSAFGGGGGINGIGPGGGGGGELSPGLSNGTGGAIGGGGSTDGSAGNALTIFGGGAGAGALGSVGFKAVYGGGGGSRTGAGGASVFGGAGGAGFGATGAAPGGGGGRQAAGGRGECRVWIL